MKFRYWWQETSLALLAVIAVTVSSLLILSSLRLHFADMKWQIQKTEFLEGNMSKMFMLARFVDQYRLFQENVSQSELDEREFQLNLLFDSKNSAAWSGLAARDLVDAISIQFVNGLRRLTHKPPIANLDEVRSLELLEQAFQLERLREYRDALSIYELLEPQIRDPRLVGIIRLHRGFCLALLGEADQARANYESVIAANRDNDLGVTATLLLRHLETILQERVALLRSNLDKLTQARKMAALLQCKDVLASFDPAELNTEEAKTEVMMLRARCQEEVGQRDSALAQYSEVIRKAGESKVARDANRRVFMLASRLEQGSRIREAAVRMNRRLKDPSFGRMQEWEELSKKNQDSSMQAGLEKEPISEDVLHSLELVTKEFGLDSVLQTKPAVSQAAPQAIKPGKAVAKIPIPEAGTSVRVELEDGKTFVGRVISAPDAEEIQIQTMIGVIGVSRKDLLAITPQ